jgi:MarR family transcriptional regulator, organic hydroperoxide resistance regulator
MSTKLFFYAKAPRSNERPYLCDPLRRRAVARNKIIFVYTNKNTFLCAVKKLSDAYYNKCIYFVSNALARKIEKMAQESWDKVNLSPSHGYLLMLVLENPGIQPMVLSEELHLSPSTITRLIEKLEQKKLAARIYEGKITNVYPTPKAKELLPKLKECVNDFYASYSSVLGKDESTKLIQTMNRIADKLAG